MNIILLISDTYRYDNLFDRGTPPVSTPNLDRFSERAVSLSNLYTSSFPTIPHRTDLISGRCGWPWYGWQSLELGTKNFMPHILKAGGYVSQLLCDCPHLFNNGFKRVFDAALQVRGQEGDMRFLRMNDMPQAAMPRDKTRPSTPFFGCNLVDLHRWQNADWTCEEDRFAPRTAGLACRWLEQNYEFDPFLLWVDFFDPHEPWDPPEYMVRKYDGDYDGPAMLHPNYGDAADYTPEELRNLRAHYCAEAEMVDRAVGRVLQKVDDLRLWDNSIVIFTTDHGFLIGEHGRVGKANLSDNDKRRFPLYPEVAHIPCMIAAPGLEVGSTVDDVIQPFDFLPTLLEMIGLEVDPPEPFHGRSFAPLLRGEKAKPPRDFAVISQLLTLEDGDLPPRSRTPMIYTQRYACAPIGETVPELYDLTEDPKAESNIAADRPEVVAELKAKVVAWLHEIDAPEERVELFL